MKKFCCLLLMIFLLTGWTFACADPDLTLQDTFLRSGAWAAEAEKELDELTQTREKLIEDLKLLLVPPDPLDDRNVIMEIRAGVGGEEAALFAGDMRRMWPKLRTALYAGLWD